MQNVFTRDDTFFGVCEALGQDFGFNANILRIILGLSLLLSPVAVIATYVGLGLGVLASRLIAPSKTAPAAEQDATATIEAVNDDQANDYALAA